MADKEERILITKCSGWCHAFFISRDPFDGDEGMYCDKSGKWVRITEKDCAKCKDPVLSGISRQEAIERIAKAICASNMEPDCLWECETCDRWKGSDKKAAEAALNALLENNK